MCSTDDKISVNSRRMRPSMNPTGGKKVVQPAVGLLSDDLADSSRREEELWNLDLSDIIKMPEKPKVDTRPANLRSSSCRDLSRALGSVEDNMPLPCLIKRHSSKNLSVKFTKVETREFQRVLEVNPSCSGGGPSLGLGWNYNQKEAVTLDKYETAKARGNNKRSISPFRGLIKTSSSSSSSRSGNKGKPLVLSPSRREKIAKELGFSKAEIRQNMEQVQKCQRQRGRTAERLLQEDLEKMMIESVGSIKARDLQRLTRINASA